MKKGVILMSWVIYFIFLFSFISSAPIQNDLNLNIQTTDESGNVITGTFDFNFTISNQADCSQPLYTNVTRLTTDVRGIVSYVLEDVNLSFNEEYSLCHYRDDVLQGNLTIKRVPQSFRTNNVSWLGVENVPTFVTEANTTFLRVDGKNLLTGNWDFGNFNILGNGNITANYFIGNGSRLTDVKSDFWDDLNTPSAIVDFIKKDGTIGLTADWDAGDFTIIQNKINVTSLTNQIIFNSNSVRYTTITSAATLIEPIILTLPFLTGTLMTLQGENTWAGIQIFSANNIWNVGEEKIDSRIIRIWFPGLITEILEQNKEAGQKPNNSHA